MSVINAIPMLLGGEGYEISRSVRLRSSASAYFNRTLTTPTNNKIWTWSGWVKRGSTIGLTSGADIILGTGTGSVIDEIRLIHDNGASGVNDSFQFTGSGWNVKTLATKRDPSAWQHFIVTVDTTQATAANRVRLYCNGIELPYDSATYPTQNSNTGINSATLHNIGARTTGGAGLQFDGYLTEVNFIDGQALTPSSFGETDAITGVWKPKKYAGTYGTNGFYLNFSDNSAATAAAIGKDNSGNGNNWTPNNISVTSGVTYDSMIDTPTMYADGGNGRGNYCVMNPLDKGTSTVTLTNGNLNWSSGAPTYNQVCRSTISVTSGKWYWEVTPLTNGAWANMGVADALGTLANASRNQPGGWVYQGTTGNKMNNNSSVAYGSTYTNNDVIGVALDMDGDTLTFYKNGVSQGVAYSSGFAGKTISPLMQDAANDATAAINFGQRPFAYTPPTGFKALNTQNLPDATIKKGNAYFDVVARAGATAPTSVTSLAFQPDLLWTKTRSAVTNHNLFDSARGLSVRLQSDNTGADAAAGSMVTSFNSNGYTFGSDYSGTNLSGSTHVDWVWKESVSAGFDIVTYTGDGINGRTVSHALGVVPKMVIVKSRSTATNWIVKHASLSSTNTLELNSTAAQGLAGSGYIGDLSSSTTFTLVNGGSAITNVNGSGTTYVAYLFSEVAGYSKFGSYTGNGSTDGPFVYLGFRPRYVLIKKSSAAGDSWFVFDTSRETSNEVDLWLALNLSNAETSNSFCDILSNGFKIRGSISAFNASGETYIYAAFAENPFKNSLAR